MAITNIWVIATASETPQVSNMSQPYHQKFMDSNRHSHNDSSGTKSCRAELTSTTATTTAAAATTTAR